MTLKAGFNGAEVIRGLVVCLSLPGFSLCALMRLTHSFQGMSTHSQFPASCCFNCCSADWTWTLSCKYCTETMKIQRFSFYVVRTLWHFSILAITLHFILCGNYTKTSFYTANRYHTNSFRHNPWWETKLSNEALLISSNVHLVIFNLLLNLIRCEPRRDSCTDACLKCRIKPGAKELNARRDTQEYICELSTELQQEDVASQSVALHYLTGM